MVLRSGLASAAVAVAMFLVSGTPATAAFTEDFNYPDGQLGGVNGWVGTPNDAATAGRLDVVSGHLQLQHVSANEVAANTVRANKAFPAVGPDGSNLITVSVFAERGTGSGGNIWFFRAKDSGGAVLAQWDGQLTTARPRIANTVGPAQNLTGSGYDELKMTLNTTSGIISYFFNGGFIGTLDSTTAPGATSIVGKTVGQVEFERQGRADFATFNGLMNFDNVSVVPEPASLGLLAIGGLLAARRRRVLLA